MECENSNGWQPAAAFHPRWFMYYSPMDTNKMVDALHEYFRLVFLVIADFLYYNGRKQTYGDNI